MNLDRLTALADQGRKLLNRQPAMSTGDWYRITNKDSDRPQVYLYDAIGEWGVSADAFVRELRAITASTLDLHINSPGGLAFDGVAIYSAIRNHPARVDAYVDGIAASAASFIAMAGDTVTVEKPARMFIHDAQGLTLGGPSEHRKMLDILDGLSDGIAEIYADRAGGTVASWREAMGAETWYSSTEAVKAGLADRVSGDDTDSAPENKRSQLIRARHRVHATALRGAA